MNADVFGPNSAVRAFLKRATLRMKMPARSSRMADSTSQGRNKIAAGLRRRLDHGQDARAGQLKTPFDFCLAMRLLGQDMIARTPSLAHVRFEQIAVVFAQA